MTRLCIDGRSDRRLASSCRVSCRQWVAAILAVCCLAGAEATAQGSIAQRTAGMEKRDGFLPLYYDRRDGALYLEARTDEEFLHAVVVTAGLTWPLDRGTVSPTQGAALAHFERHGGQLLLVQRNTSFRAGELPLAGVVGATFPPSVLGTFSIVAEEGGRLLVQGTEFFLRDAFDVPGRLRAVDETSIRLDPQRSAIADEGTWGSAHSTDVEALLTFTSDRPGAWVEHRAADGRSLALRQRHSFIELPSSGFRARGIDQRLGLTPTAYYDFGDRSDRGSRRALVNRWRLEKKDPRAALSEPIRPLIFHLERAIPSAERTAFRQGILYWNRVFEAAGFRNAIQVADLPAGADPFDWRFPIVVLWSADRTLKASMGQTISDPRTGELLKAILLMDGHRSQIDANTYAAIRPALASGQPSAVTFVAARLEWLAAHEAGHILASLAHNSVVPSQVGFLTPAFDLSPDGRLKLDVSAAGHAAPLAYDQWAVKYLYTPTSAGDEEQILRGIVGEGLRQGLRYVDDNSTRAMPRATGRLHGSDVLSELEAAMKIRQVMLEHFGEAAVFPGEPLSLLRDRLVPVYFHHQFVIAAAAKSLGGVDYTYAVQGDGQTPGRSIDPVQQRRALELLIGALRPGQLAIPGRIAALVPPAAPAAASSELLLESAEPDSFALLTGESAPIRIPNAAGGVFDPLGWAQALSSLVVNQILDAQRAARIVALQLGDPKSVSLADVIGRLIAATWGEPTDGNPGTSALQWMVRRTVLDRLLSLHADRNASWPVKAEAARQLALLERRLQAWPFGSGRDEGYVVQARRDIQRALDPAAPDPPR